MARLAGLLAFLLATGIAFFSFRSQFTGQDDLTQGTGNPRAVIDITGVKNDLLGMAQAERAYQALNGRFGSLEELRASGDLLLDPDRGRDGYTYSSEASEREFHIYATYQGPADMPDLAIDQTMEIVEFW